MKKFNFQFTKLTKVFIYLGLALAAAAIGVNTYLLIANGISSAADPTIKIIQYTAMYFAAALLTVVLVSLLVSSYYSIEDKTLKTCFGIVKTKYDIDKIESVLLDRNTKKLSVYFNENKFIVIVVKEEWYEDFVAALLKANPKIEFSINSKENTPDDEEKKKK